MSSKIWLATGEFTKLKRVFKFSRELLAPKEEHVREKIYSELGSRHKVGR
ncbi:MAG: 50S ribosomal protein L18a, partial [Candidatus Thorarchaeota archaeon]|nr:50S ribosomal protein L18a [Candidatus Thorarchaeota archaeon]